MGMLQSEDSEESWIEARHYDRKTGRETCSVPTALVWMRCRRSQSGNRDPFQRIIAKR
jgi:PIN domain nuclease of toxin-antitoxin system